MKKSFSVLLCIFFLLHTYGQHDTTALYKQYPTTPPFSITRVPDSTKFTKADLKTKTPVLFIEFSPDCEHCQHETQELIKNMDLFSKVQIIMISPLDYAYINNFYREYHIADYPNITMGRDDAYFLGTFFHLSSLPAIYLYDKKGRLIQSFEGSVAINKIAEAFN